MIYMPITYIIHQPKVGVSGKAAVSYVKEDFKLTF